MRLVLTKRENGAEWKIIAPPIRFFICADKVIFFHNKHLADFANILSWRKLFGKFCLTALSGISKLNKNSNFFIYFLVKVHSYRDSARFSKNRAAQLFELVGANFSSRKSGDYCPRPHGLAILFLTQLKEHRLAIVDAPDFAGLALLNHKRICVLPRLNPGTKVLHNLGNRNGPVNF